jgi:hypothetical protein
MMLEYWREYRTYFHIAQTHGISESAAYRNIKWFDLRMVQRLGHKLRKHIAVLQPITILREGGRIQTGSSGESRGRPEFPRRMAIALAPQERA